MLLTIVFSLISRPILPPLPPLAREFRGAWVATVDTIDWPLKRGDSTAKARTDLLKIIERAAEIHLNALVFQVRPSADALYASKIEPWSEYLTGKQGVEPKPLWDPLAFAIAEAHKRGIAIHAWFNPFRAESPAQHGPNAETHISRLHPEAVVKYGKFLWMDPGEPIVQKQTHEVILDVVNRYDIDGVQIDDYFYPYKERSRSGGYLDFPDTRSWKKYLASGGVLTRDDWRRKNVDDFVQKIYAGIKAAKPWVLFGISPFGIYRPGVPEGIKAGVDQYSELYADPLKWLKEGWCDYLSPQLYWAVSQKAQAYDVLLKWWSLENSKGRHIWPGNYTSRILPSEGKWEPREILDQIHDTRDLARSDSDTGNIQFSFKVFSEDAKGINEALLEGPYEDVALVPESPWLNAGRPLPRAVDWIETRSGAFHNYSFAKQEGAASWAETCLVDGHWQPWKVSDRTNWTLKEPPTAIAVMPISRTGANGPPIVWRPSSE